MEIAAITGPGLSVTIPTFPRGASSVPGSVFALTPALDTTAHYPFFMPEGLIHRIIAEEVIARRERATWVEKAWFLAGRIERTDRDIAACVTGILPAEGAEASASAIAFSVATWASLHRSLRPGETCLGWIHAHSLDAILEAGVASEGKEPVGGQAASGGTGEATGLFISPHDIAAARRSFRVPMLTGILDSDAAMRLGEGKQVALQRVLGFWGWCGGHLRPRSINVVHTSEETRA